VDSSLVEGGEVSAHYDSMVAKLVAHGSDREEARRKLLSAVRHCVLLGLPNNQAFLADCLNDAVFVQGLQVHTGFVAERMGMPPPTSGPRARTVALAALAAQAPNLPQDAQGHLQAGALAQGQATGLLEWAGQRWRYAISPMASPHRTIWLVQCTSESSPDEPVSLSLMHVQWVGKDHSTLTLECEGLREQICIARTDTGVQLFHQGQAWAFECCPKNHASGQDAVSGALLAPLTARVMHVMVTHGQNVKAGERLLVLEAMKMEHTLSAPFDGVVSQLLTQAGGQVLKGDLLIQVDAEAT
jgi:geranyl-CoA carboxylase alpha subunit